MEILSFETIDCLNYNIKRQKRLDVSKDVKVNFLVLGFIGCIKSILFLDIIYFFILSMWAMEFAEKMALINFCLEFA